MVRHQNSQPLVGDVAAKLMKRRLAIVLKRLHQAAQASPDAPEPVHQLRVACRRAKAAIDFFATALPPRKSKWFLRKLRKFRKAADEARNLDVYRQRLARQDAAPPAEVLALLSARRIAAQKPLRKLDKQWHASKRWSQKQRQYLKKMRASRQRAAVLEQPFHVFVPLALEPALTEFTTALQSPDKSAKRLHELRVAGKHLRYALELLESTLPKRGRISVFKQLERLQDLLGNLNDFATAETLVAELALRAEGDARRWLQTRRKQERAGFNEGRAKFWRGWTQKERQKWQATLKRCAPANS